jgi:hypothetical protein
MPEATLSREQSFTFVYRALPILGVGVSDSETLPASFSDASEIASWGLRPPLHWWTWGSYRVRMESSTRRAADAGADGQILSMAVYG